jgi:class 3 adenylate cyclase
VSEQVPPSSRASDPGGRTTDDAGAAIRTYLIADVRGNTRFTQELGDEAAAKLAAKFAGIARKGVEARGGEVIELRGDEALAVFTSARQAIRAALYLQELFLEESGIRASRCWSESDSTQARRSRWSRAIAAVR